MHLRELGIGYGDREGNLKWTENIGADSNLKITNTHLSSSNVHPPRSALQLEPEPVRTPSFLDSTTKYSRIEPGRTALTQREPNGWLVLEREGHVFRVNRLDRNGSSVYKPPRPTHSLLQNLNHNHNHPSPSSSRSSSRTTHASSLSRNRHTVPTPRSPTMEVINLILAVVVMLTQLSRVPFSFPDVYHLAVAGVETAVCGPPAVSSYLALLCGTLDVARLPATPAVVVNVFPSAVLAGFHDASVFDPSFTGCLVNCTVVEPAPVYFGPFFPAADVIVAPKFALLAPPAPRVPPSALHGRSRR
ncbi:hypothetical protein BC629DRAFT_979289 [Irpex lacteus]|nr:hypothetical protein BC629DRAFT_979289 [Irpex lacteus]